MNRENHLWLRWVTANGIGEMLGLAIAVGVDLLCFRLLPQPVVGFNGLVLLTIMLAVGFAEGVVLGFFQTDTLAAFFPRLNRRAWLAATGIGISVSWLIGVLAAKTVVPALMKSTVDDLTGLIFYAVLGGGIFGAVIGLFQWVVLKKYSEKAGLWILANALAYPCGVFVLYGAILLGHRAGQPDVVFGLGAVAGLVSGSLIGIVTGRFLIMLAGIPVAESRPREKTSSPG